MKSLMRAKNLIASSAIPLMFITSSLFAQATKQKPAQATKNGADWPLYSGDLAGTKFSPLAQITASNVTNLKPAWTYNVREGGAGAPGSPEATPIVVNGVMYFPAGNRVMALDAETGREIWRYAVSGGSANTRGVAYWPGDANNPPRVIFTVGKNMFGLNAKTGKLDPGFGKEGVVDIGIDYNGAPTLFRNAIMLGTSYMSGGPLPYEIAVGPPGDTRAYDARTGAKMWNFRTVPQPGELGHETWLDDGWKERSGVNVWGWYMSVDEKRGLLYMPLGGPAVNYWGGDRPGANLFANSIVAVDANTGKYKWHFQTVHHDIWDFDLPPAPGLVDITVKGKKIPALAQIGKAGYMFILDRTTGKPVFGVEERPVPKGDVPGEWYSPTQPFPLKPPPLARVGFTMNDLVTAEDTTPEHAQACRDLVARSGGLYNEGPFTPFLFHAADAPPKSTIQFPGGTGGVNWGGTATDPRTGFIYMNSHDNASVGWVEKKVEGGNYGSGNGSPQPYDRGSVNGPGPYNGFSAQVKDKDGKTIGSWPCQKPPWGRLIAVNANTGEIAWQSTLGLNESLPPGKQNTGGSGSAGPIVTAGGLVFIGATSDARFRAFDSKTGKELWTYKLDRPANANPLTYLGKNGKQFVAVMATDTVTVFALP
jgi:quinoprotein glucose dehydrogenase